MTDEERKQYISSLIKFIKETWESLEKTEGPYFEKVLQMAIASTWRNAEDKSLQPLIGGDDKDRELWSAHLDAMIGWFNTVLTLRNLHEVDPRMAEEAAKNIYLLAYTGDTYGEIIWEEAIMHGVPVPVETMPPDQTIEQCQEDIKEFRDRQAARGQVTWPLGDFLTLGENGQVVKKEHKPRDLMLELEKSLRKDKS